MVGSVRGVRVDASRAGGMLHSVLAVMLVVHSLISWRIDAFRAAPLGTRMIA